MSMQDPIADMLTRIRNSLLKNHLKVNIPYSTIKENIAKILTKEGFIIDYTIEENNCFRTIMITLKYDSQGNGIIRSIKRVSKPGLRIHKGYINREILLTYKTSKNNSREQMK